MKRDPYLLLFLVSLVIGSLGLLFGIASAASDCPGVVTPYGRIANVRPQPNMVASPVATLAANNSLPAHEAVKGWYPLCGGNYISESVARYMTNTPQPTVTAAPRATPTRIQHNLIWCSSEPEVRKIGNSWIVECER